MRRIRCARYAHWADRGIHCYWYGQAGWGPSLGSTRNAINRWRRVALGPGGRQGKYPRPKRAAGVAEAVFPRLSQVQFVPGCVPGGCPRSVVATLFLEGDLYLHTH